MQIVHVGKPRECRLCTAVMQIVHVEDTLTGRLRAHRAFSAFYASAGLRHMKVEDIQRKIQFRQGSYAVTIPLQIVHALGIRKNQYVRFAVSKNKVIIKPVESNITKKDVARGRPGSVYLDRYGERRIQVTWGISPRP